MKENILIVEDEYIVANDLRLKLMKAGYPVCGIAASVDDARKLIEKHKPTWVLLDIFLQDGSMGTDLAAHLTEKNIGFIYISANTNQSVLEIAKATQPSGFLVKPFREKDLLIMLDIAMQKHQSNLQLIAQRELVWKRQIDNIVEASVSLEVKLERIPGAFQSFIPFDYMKINLPGKRDGDVVEYNFVRTGFDEYQVFKGAELYAAMGLASTGGFRKQRTADARPNGFQNGIDYSRSLLDDVWEKQLSTYYQLCSRLTQHIVLEDGDEAMVSFYSKKNDTYSESQERLLRKTEVSLKQLLTQIQNFKTVVAPATRVKPADVPAAKPVNYINEKFDGIIGKSPALLRVLDRITMVSQSTTSVLITGDSGTGKEKIAQCLHKLSPRKNKPMVVVNCGALPFELIESELFGHEKGAFTGAADKRIGKFETADGGTIFLDEIGELPLEAQVKLLRVLQEMEFERVGSSKTIKVDVRVIAATNRNLEKEVSQGRFRLDLYYRLNVFPIELPPLKDRKEDIPLLAQSFIAKFCSRMGKPAYHISPEAIATLQKYTWPGNIRELEHVIERSVLMAKATTIEDIVLPAGLWQTAQPTISDKTDRIKTLEENEAEHIISVLKSCGGRIGGAGGAAEILGLPASTLHSKIKKLGIRKEFDFE